MQLPQRLDDRVGLRCLEQIVENRYELALIAADSRRLTAVNKLVEQMVAREQVECVVGRVDQVVLLAYKVVYLCKGRQVSALFKA